MITPTRLRSALQPCPACVLQASRGHTEGCAQRVWRVSTRWLPGPRPARNAMLENTRPLLVLPRICARSVAPASTRQPMLRPSAPTASRESMQGKRPQSDAQCAQTTPIPLVQPAPQNKHASATVASPGPMVDSARHLHPLLLRPQHGLRRSLRRRTS